MRSIWKQRSPLWQQCHVACDGHGQSTAAWLDGNRRGDTQWDKVRDRNLARLVPNRRRNKVHKI